MGLLDLLAASSSAPKRLVRTIALKRRSSAAVGPDRRTYSERLGFSHHGSVWSGELRSPKGGCWCLIEKRGDVFRVWLKGVPAGAFRHHHGGCLHAEKGGWYALHLSRQPKDRQVDSLIRYLERLLAEWQALS